MPPAINSEILANRNIKTMLLFLRNTVKKAQNPTTNMFKHKTYKIIQNCLNYKQFCPNVNETVGVLKLNLS